MYTAGNQLFTELHETQYPFVSRIEFIRSKLSNFSAYVGIRGHRVIFIRKGVFIYLY